MLPLLQPISGQKEYKMSIMADTLAKIFKVTDEERRELLPSGTDEIFDNRLGWAKTYLKKARLLD